MVKIIGGEEDYMVVDRGFVYVGCYHIGVVAVEEISGEFFSYSVGGFGVDFAGGEGLDQMEGFVFSSAGSLGEDGVKLELCKAG